MTAAAPSLLDDAAGDAGREIAHELARLADGAARVERIVSLGQSSPGDFWYDQDEDEWVLVLTGQARLSVLNERGQPEEISLGPGQHLFLPAHRRHRIEWTTPDEPTVWLAVFARVG